MLHIAYRARHRQAEAEPQPACGGNGANAHRKTALRGAYSAYAVQLYQLSSIKAQKRYNSCIWLKLRLVRRGGAHGTVVLHVSRSSHCLRTPGVARAIWGMLSGAWGGGGCMSPGRVTPERTTSLVTNIISGRCVRPPAQVFLTCSPEVQISLGCARVARAKQRAREACGCSRMASKSDGASMRA